MNLVTKSGTNGIHGTGYYYERNQALAVTNPFNTLGDLPLENVQWGASLGGPFWKDHTFWFANFEKQKFNIATGNSGYTPDKYYSDAAYALLAASGVTPNSATAQLVLSMGRYQPGKMASIQSWALEQGAIAARRPHLHRAPRRRLAV